MFDREQLEKELDFNGHGHDHQQLTYGELIHATVFGVAGALLAGTFELFDVAREFLTESPIRFVTGASDGLAEGIFTIRKELPKYLKGNENKGGRTVYYVGGKVSGAILSWIPDFSIRLFGWDPHSSFPGSLGSTSYAQSDLALASAGMLIYHLKNYGIRNGIKNYINDPVALSSLAIYGLSLTGNVLSRNYGLVPENFLHDWLETYALSLMCLIPPLIGGLQERRLRRRH